MSERLTDKELDRIASILRVSGQPRDTQGRWTRWAPSEQRELLELAKDVSTGTAGRFPSATRPLLSAAAAVLHTYGWAPTQTCPARGCPRPMHKHVCSCPHALARKRLQAFGLWPTDGR